MKFAPSTYQAAVLAAVKNVGGGHYAINAVAGSGKTTTLMMILETLPTSDAIMVAFNKHIVTEINARLVGMGKPELAKTTHSAGLAIVNQNVGKGRVRVDNWKYRNYAKQWVETHPEQFKGVEYVSQTNLAKLATLARMRLTNVNDTDALWNLCDVYDIDLNNVDAVPWMLEQGKKHSRQNSDGVTPCVDFADMLWLPVAMNMKFPTYSLVLTDESQDFNPCQQEFIARLVNPNGGRIFFVGDPRQAIMGFAGADTNSFGNMVERFNATSLPLSVCYRCPVSHIEMAKAIVPEIAPRENAPEGTIVRETVGNLHKLVQTGDMVLGRFTAPLVKECFRLIKANIAAKVRGKDIGEDLIALVKRIVGKGDFANWFDLKNLYYEKMIRQYSRKPDSDMLIERLNDQMETVEIFYENAQANTLEGLIASIESLFSDDVTPVLFSTIHRAKGLEASRVFVMGFSKLPMRRNKMSQEQATQEDNLYYVALTRSKDTMYLLD